MSKQEQEHRGTLLSDPDVMYVNINSENLGNIHAVEPVALSWQDISYSVMRKSLTGKSLGRLDILKCVTGRSLPGQLTAILGPSGSGKTTLLDVLADRIHANTDHVLSGSIDVGGRPRDVASFRAMASYVAQEDSLMGSFTCLETLRFAAKLSIAGKVTKAEREARVQQAIDDMGLRSCQDTLVGDLFRKGMSGGQKRRLSIAIELLSHPTILLLDEPTSGLDSASTYNVMKYIQKLCTQRQCTVVCTIHQPSSAVYNMFSNVMLLVKGETVFFGPPSAAFGHFASLGHECPQYSNPAEYFLSLVNTDFEGHVDVAVLLHAYKVSSQATNVVENIEADRTAEQARAKMIIQVETPSMLAQFSMLMHRNTLNNIRNPGIYWVRMFMYVMLSLMVGTMYIKWNHDITVEDLPPVLFYVQAFLVFMSVAVLPFFIEQRPVFTRERANNSLSVVAYAAANFLAALPGIALIAIVSSAIVVGFAGLNSFGYFVLNLFLSLVVAESLMHVLAAAVPHYIIGIALGAGIFGMFMLCEGFMVPKPAIKGYWIWGYYIAFHSYSFESFMYKQFEPMQTDAATQILEHFGMTHVDVDRDMGILAAYAILLQLIFVFILWKFHTGRR